MSPLIALYTKEIKDNRKLFLFLLIGTVCLDLLVLVTIETNVLAAFICGLPIWSTVFILPFVLAHSYTTEWKTSTSHLLLSLPIRPSIAGLSKYLAVLSMGVVLFGISAAAIHLVTSRAPDGFTSQLPNIFGITGTDVFEYAMVGYFSFLFLLLGLVSGMEGVKFSVARFRGLISLASFVLGLYLYSIFVTSFLAAFQGVMDVGLAIAVYSILAGLVYLVMGLFLFERYAEI